MLNDGARIELVAVVCGDIQTGRCYGRATDGKFRLPVTDVHADEQDDESLQLAAKHVCSMLHDLDTGAKENLIVSVG